MAAHHDIVMSPGVYDDFNMRLSVPSKVPNIARYNQNMQISTTATLI